MNAEETLIKVRELRRRVLEGTAEILGLERRMDELLSLTGDGTPRGKRLSREVARMRVLKARERK